MDKEAVEVIMDKLELLASKLGVTGEYMFGIYIKQASVQILSFIVFSCIWVLMLALTGWAIKYSIEKDAWKRDEVNPANLSVIIGGSASIILCVVFLTTLNTVLACYFNPEYYALKQLLSVLN